MGAENRPPHVHSLEKDMPPLQPSQPIESASGASKKKAVKALAILIAVVVAVFLLIGIARPGLVRTVFTGILPLQQNSMTATSGGVSTDVLVDAASNPAAGTNEGERLGILKRILEMIRNFLSKPTSTNGEVDAFSSSANKGVIEPVLSYAPTCTSSCATGCLSGTEVQAIESFDGKLYAGTSNWMETLACVWPATSAQINVLSTEAGSWQRTPDLPKSSKCATGAAAWEQVNDLHAATFTTRGALSKHLFASTLVNEDGACPGLQASVFYLDARGQSWINTGLDARLETFYGAMQTEVRYMETFSDGSAECPSERPCLFAFVGPRKRVTPPKFPSVWRGRYDPGNTACSLICWDAAPEVSLDGIQAPVAARILSSDAGENGLFFGTGAYESGKCPDANKLSCHRAALMQRVAPKTWTPVWLGPPVQEKDADEAVRGISSWKYPGGAVSLWFITIPKGAVYRVDALSGGRSEPVVEARLTDLIPEPCNARILPYQIYIHRQGSGDANPELLVASESCGTSIRNSVARIFHRPVSGGSAWSYLEMPELTYAYEGSRANPAAVRWIQTSPFDSGNIFFGTTDMNSGDGSLTGRIYRLDTPFD